MKASSKDEAFFMQLGFDLEPGLELTFGLLKLDFNGSSPVFPAI
jgi:hypothetical protein